MILLTLLVACTDTDNDERKKEALKIAEDFVEINYTVSDYKGTDREKHGKKVMEELKPYLTKEEFLNLKKGRVGTYPLELAKRSDYNINVKQFDINGVEEKNDGVLDVQFGLKLQFTDNPNKPERTININGELTLSDNDGKWKISRYWIQEIDPQELE